MVVNENGFSGLGCICWIVVVGRSSRNRTVLVVFPSEVSGRKWLIHSINEIIVSPETFDCAPPTVRVP